MRQLNRNLQMVFDASSKGLNLTPTVLRGIFFAFVTNAVVWILKPDLFGLIPNSLDPLFYTGYAINFDDAIRAAGNNHYFVTRWTTYMPMYLCSEIFGPYWGRLVLRLGMILVLAEMFWRVGFQLRLGRASRIFGAFVVLTAPMFVRAFTTDYSEYFIIWGSIFLCLLLISFANKPGVLKSSTIGLLTASMVIANPTAAVVAGITVLIGMFTAWKLGNSLSRVIFHSFLGTLVMATTVGLGYWIFKYWYDIGNVYSPTIQFIRNYQAPADDPWTAPNNDWISFFSWLYIPPVLLLLTFLALIKRELKQRKFILSVSAIVAATYISHVYIEITRGNALETSYYWSMSLGPVLVLLFLLVGHFANRNGVRWSIALAIATIFLIRFRIPQQVQLPSGLMLYICLLLFVLISLRTLIEKPKLGASLLIASILWLQIGGSSYTTRTHGGDLNSPRYDLVYNSKEAESDSILRETIWFLRQMDKVHDDWNSIFLSAGGWSSSIVGTYIAHPLGRWIVPISSSEVLNAKTRNELEFSFIPNLVIYGDPETVESLKSRVLEELSSPQPLIDVTNPGGLKYRLVVLRGNSKDLSETTFLMSQLSRSVGTITDFGSVSVEGMSQNGYVSYGPFLGLGLGSYSATLDFSSSDRENLGYFEIYDDVTKTSIKSSLESSGQGQQRLTIKFIVQSKSASWQFRTVYSGQSRATFHQIKLRKLIESPVP